MTTGSIAGASAGTDAARAARDRAEPAPAPLPYYCSPEATGGPTPDNDNGITNSICCPARNRANVHLHFAKEPNPSKMYVVGDYLPLYIVILTRVPY